MVGHVELGQTAHTHASSSVQPCHGMVLDCVRVTMQHYASRGTIHLGVLLGCVDTGVVPMDEANFPKVIESLVGFVWQHLALEASTLRRDVPDSLLRGIPHHPVLMKLRRVP